MDKVIVRRQPQGRRDTLPPDLHPLLARLFRHRGLVSEQELARSLAAIHPFEQLAGIAEAVALLRRALESRWHILVVADFDADGATSCALAVRALRLMGAARVDYLVPNRFDFGYGLTEEIVAVAARSSPDLIITVDNGISSIEGVAAARALGIHVLVTDHHLPGAQLPDADAIVNPNQPGDRFPSKALAGVGVIFYVMMALRAALRDSGGSAAGPHGAGPNLAALLDLVALGTVADVVPLDHNNRILVAQGLARIRRGLGCAGINALIRVAGRRRDGLVASDLGFALGPRLNAAGRLDDMSLGIACLLSDDDGEALQMAQRLDELNRERRTIEHTMQSQALAVLDDVQLDAEQELPFGICLYDPDWHQGVIGILAARIRERFHRPVIAFAADGEGRLKGSARSLPGLHIRDLLDTIASRHPGLLLKFGGHSMAAGLSIESGDYARFARAFDEQVRAQLSAEDLRGVVHSDGELTTSELSLDIAELLQVSGPWGQGFPEPVFDGRFEVLSRTVLKERHLKWQLRPLTAADEHAGAVEALAFNASDALFALDAATVRAAYRLSVNEWNGRRRVQLLVEHLEPCARGPG